MQLKQHIVFRLIALMSVSVATILSLEIPANAQGQPLFTPPPSHDVFVEFDSGFINNENELSLIHI